MAFQDCERVIVVGCLPNAGAWPSEGVGGAHFQSPIWCGVVSPFVVDVF